MFVELSRACCERKRCSQLYRRSLHVWCHKASHSQCRVYKLSLNREPCVAPKVGGNDTRRKWGGRVYTGCDVVLIDVTCLMWVAIVGGRFTHYHDAGCNKWFFKSSDIYTSVSRWSLRGQVKHVLCVYNAWGGSFGFSKVNGTMFDAP